MTTNRPHRDPWEGTDVIGQTVKDLPVLLTQSEVLDRGRALALQLRAVDAMKDEHAEARRQLKAEQSADMQAAMDELARLRNAVNDGKEPRPVACVFLADFARGVRTTVRTDTSETVSTRRLQSDEVQVQIATPLRVVPDPETGKLMRADGRSTDTLPFVRPEQCNPLRCRDCEHLHGSTHAEDCEHHGLGAARLVTTDQCDAQSCLECDAPVGQRHAADCPHHQE